MIVVVHPRREVIRRLQAAETHYYFSIAAESVIRRHGLINVESVDETTVAARKGHVPVLTRSTFANPDILLDGVAAFEAPLHPGMSKRLGLSGETAAFETLTVRSCRTGDSWTVFRPYIEKTPAAESERVTPWTNRAIGVELFDGITSDVAMDMILPDGRTFPAVFRHGRAWVCAFPIFDLIAEHFAVPPLDQRYAACTRMEELNTLADTVLRGLIEHAERNPDFQSVRCARWPEGYNSAFAIRHDYDRPISDTALALLLALHQKTGLKCSVGILAYETPSDQIAALVERGHEIQFHAFESSYHDLRTHLSSLTEVVGRRIRGATVHGGASGPGFRGDKHISWFERAGFRYTETFQIDGYPSPIYRPGGDGIMARTTLMASMQHLSLDISTKPEEHRKETLLTSIPRRLKAGDGVVLMNHPDIHREALAQILAALPTAGVWHATTGDIVAWERASKHDVSATAEGANLQVLYKEPLPQAAVIEIGRGDQSRRLTIPAGTTQVSLKDGKLETATASTAKGRTGVLKDAMGAAMSGLSRLPDRAGKQYAATTEMVRTISQSVGQTKPQFAVISRLGTSSAKDAALSGVKADQAVVLQHAKGAAGESDLLSTLVSANAWAGKTPVLGRSLMEELHPLVAGALAQAISKQSSAAVRDGRSRTLSPVEQQSSAEAALASWILGQAEAATQSSGAIGQGELSYFLASGGNRSLGLTKLLRRLSKQRIGTLVEHGAGIGLIPWLVANEADMEIGRVLLVEPQQRYTTAATALWSPAAEGSTAEMEWADSVSEDYAYTGPVDVVLFCHCMFRMNRAQRQGMLELAWAALRPGGLLIVNEVVREAAEDTAIGPDIVALPDLIAQMTFGEKAPSVFRSDTDWRRAESPSRLSPSEIGSTSFFVAEKPLDAPEPETFARPAVKAEAAPPPPGGEVFKTAFFGTLDDGDDPQDKKDLLRSALSEAAFAAVQDGKVVFANTMANSANCKPRCAQMIEKSVGQIESAGIIKALDLEGFGIPEETRFTQEPVGAFLRENYQEMVFGDQAKRRIDRAKRNEYICTVFRFRDYQEDLQKISEKVPKRDASNFPPLRHDCPYHGQFNFGCFDQGKLIAYIQVAVRGEIAFLLRVAADGEVRPFLTVETVRHVFETYPAVQVVFQRARSPDALVGMGATVSELAIVAPHTSVDTSAEDDDE